MMALYLRSLVARIVLILILALNAPSTIAHAQVGAELLDVPAHIDPPGPTCPGCRAAATGIALKQFGYQSGVSVERLPKVDRVRVNKLANLVLADFASQARSAFDPLNPPVINLRRLAELTRQTNSELESEQREQQLEVERQERLEEGRRQRIEAERQAQASRRQRASELFSNLDEVSGEIAWFTNAENSICVFFKNSSREWTIEDSRTKIGSETVVLVDASVERRLQPFLRELSAVSDVRRVESGDAITRLARLRNSDGEYRHVDESTLDSLKAVSELSSLSDGNPIVFTEDVQVVIRLLADCNTTERNQLWKVARTWSDLDLARLQKVIHVIKAPIISVSEENGALKLRLRSGQNVVEHRDLGRNLPVEWEYSIKHGICLVDVSTVVSPSLKAELCQRLTQVTNRWGASVHWMLTTRDDSRERLAMMYGSDDSFEFTTDDSIAKVASKGEECLAALRKVEEKTTNRPGARVRILSGHEGSDTEVVAKWIAEANRPDSPFAGRHLVVVACNIGPEQMYRFVNVAIDKGALSVSVPHETVSLHALTLAAQRIGKVKSNNETPLGYWRECYQDARRAILECKKASNPLDALRIEFGEAAILFQTTSGTLDENQVIKLLEKLQKEFRSFGPSFGLNAFRNAVVFI